MLLLAELEARISHIWHSSALAAHHTCRSTLLPPSTLPQGCGGRDGARWVGLCVGCVWGWLVVSCLKAYAGRKEEKNGNQQHT
jgi:hypothetical protein